MAEGAIPLHQMIRTLRSQLERSMAEAEGAKLRFHVESLDLELKITATEGSEVGGGIGWSVLKFGAKTDARDETVHTLRLRLTPKAKDGKDVELGGEMKG